jgi:hypothetical protein
MVDIAQRLDYNSRSSRLVGGARGQGLSYESLLQWVEYFFNPTHSESQVLA